MEFETQAYVVGEVKSEVSMRELAQFYAPSDLQVRLSRYSIEVSCGNSLTIGEFWPDEKEWIFERDGGSRADCLELARLLSAPLTARDIAHRFEVYDEASEELIGYFAHRWQPNCPQPDEV